MRDPDDTLQTLLAKIDVSTERQKFGPEGEPGVKVALPIDYATASVRESICPQPSSFASSDQGPMALRILSVSDVAQLFGKGNG